MCFNAQFFVFSVTLGQLKRFVGELEYKLSRNAWADQRDRLRDLP
jgi:hypothetical protein